MCDQSKKETKTDKKVDDEFDPDEIIFDPAKRPTLARIKQLTRTWPPDRPKRAKK